MVTDRFYLCNGDNVGSLEELLEKLKVIDEDCFSHHVNEEKNDFVNWINDCIGNKSLAKRISKLKNKADIIIAIDKKVNTPAKIKGRIISQIKREILNETN